MMLVKFGDRDINMQQEDETDLLVAKTISRVVGLLVIERTKMTKISRRKRSVPKRHILKAKRTIHESSTKVNILYDEPIWKNF